MLLSIPGSAHKVPVKLQHLAAKGTFCNIFGTPTAFLVWSVPLFALPVCSKYRNHISKTNLSSVITWLVQLILVNMTYQHIHTIHSIKCFSCKIYKEMKEALMLKSTFPKKQHDCERRPLWLITRGSAW